MVKKNEINGKRQINENFDELYKNVVVVGETSATIADTASQNVLDKTTGEAIIIPAGALIVESWIVSRTAATDTNTYRIGFTDDDNAVLDSVAANSVFTGSNAVIQGLLCSGASAAATFTADQTLIYTIDTAASTTAGVQDVMIRYIDRKLN